jgi:hypothetical protein
LINIVKSLFVNHSKKFTVLSFHYDRYPSLVRSANAERDGGKEERRQEKVINALSFLQQKPVSAVL